MSEKYFITDSLALAPYLLNNGLQYYETRMGVGKNNKKRILFVFLDPKHAGKDLERAFLNSVENKYKQSLHYFRNQIKLCQENQ